MALFFWTKSGSMSPGTPTPFASCHRAKSCGVPCMLLHRFALLRPCHNVCVAVIAPSDMRTKGQCTRLGVTTLSWVSCTVKCASSPTVESCAPF
eukprot:1461205-Amphidinium_carterae.1